MGLRGHRGRSVGGGWPCSGETRAILSRDETYPDCSSVSVCRSLPLVCTWDGITCLSPYLYLSIWP